jgi:hypothetical protein
MNPMICSVVNLLFFMSVLLGDGLYSFYRYGSVGQVTTILLTCDPLRFIEYFLVGRSGAMR